MNKDESIKAHIEEELKGNRLLRTVNIKIEVNNGRVTLYGTVDVLAEKLLAEELANKVGGVVGVDNSLTVVMDREVHDKQIVAELQHKLEQDPRVDLHRVAVNVSDGVVYLTGTADSVVESQTAFEMAVRTYGVKEVVNQLVTRND